jgi:hypothetical protein
MSFLFGSENKSSTEPGARDATGNGDSKFGSLAGAASSAWIWGKRFHDTGKWIIGGAEDE